MPRKKQTTKKQTAEKQTTKKQTTKKQAAEEQTAEEQTAKMQPSGRRGAARFTWFFVEAYEETPSEIERLRELRMSYREYACIRHDMDTYDDKQALQMSWDMDGEAWAAMPRDSFGHVLKKPHWHFVYRTNQRTVKNFAAELCVDERFVQGVTSPEAALRYLVHADNSEKYQYPHEAIEGTLAFRALDALKHDVCPDDDQCVLDLLALVYEHKPVNLAELASLAARAGLFSAYRKNYAMVRDCYREMVQERAAETDRLSAAQALEESRRQRADHEKAVEMVREDALKDAAFVERAAVIADKNLFANHKKALDICRLR